MLRHLYVALRDVSAQELIELSCRLVLICAVLGVAKAINLSWYGVVIVADAQISPVGAADVSVGGSPVSVVTVWGHGRRYAMSEAWRQIVFVGAG